MPAERQNFDVFAGDDAVLRVTIEDEDGEPLNIVGATLAWHMAASERTTSPDVLSKATGGSGITITDGAAGEIEIALADSDTEDLDGLYYHRVVLTDGQGNISTVTTGRARFRRKVA